MVAKAWLFLSFLVIIYSQLEELEGNMSIYEGGEEYMYISHPKKEYIYSAKILGMNFVTLFGGD